jgi:Streptomycin adenylyltransferase
MSEPDDGWDARVSSWAHARGDIKALVQIGSRVQAGASVDAWSDYDYQIITSAPHLYRDGAFMGDLGLRWASSAKLAFGNSVKVTGVFKDALEADFVILRHVDLQIATFALGWPSTAPFWPAPLRKGVDDLRIVAAPGWKVIKGGAPWAARYSKVAPLRSVLIREEFNELCDEFWVHLVWAAKKAARGELIASQRAVHVPLIENSLRIFQEQAFLEGRRAFPLGRRAESWLSPGQLRVLSAGTRPDKAALLAVLHQLSDEFASASAAVARLNGWAVREPQDVRAWLAGYSGSDSPRAGALG